MSSKNLASRSLTLVLFLLVASASVLGQPRPVRQAKDPSQTPDDQPRKVKTERGDAYTRWLIEDVAPIVTDAERRAYLKLKTNEEREQFIKLFWDERDPDPDTKENEYREEYYERITYANEHYSSGKPGTKTDRGRIYIKFGKPDEIESHPSGGTYQRMSYEGSGTITAYPFEKWFYRHLPGVGSGIEIEFVDPTGSGEYRLARDANEKNAMAHGRVAADPLESTYRREQDSPFSIIDKLARLEQPPEFSRRLLNGTVGGPVLDDNPLNFDIRADFFKLSDGRVLTAFTLQTENRDLTFKDSGGVQTARLNIFGKIITVTAQRVGEFEDSVTTNATIAELTEARDRRSAYSKAVVLGPGNYRADVIVRDTVSGATGIRQFGFQVPRYEGHRLATSSMILASKLESMEGKVAAGPFVIGQTKVIPNLTGTFRQGQPVGVYLELYHAGIDQTTLRPAVDVEYLLLKDGKEIYKQAEDWRGINDSGQRLTLARLIATRDFTPGEYELTIRINDRVSSQSLSPAARFTLLK